MRLAQDKGKLEKDVGTTVGTTEDLKLIEFLMDFFEENKKVLQSRVKPEQRTMFQKIVGRMSDG
jgi:hypothetical protein